MSTATRTRFGDETDKDDRVRENREDGVMQESKALEGNLPPQKRVQRLPRHMMKLASDRQAEKVAILPGSLSATENAELPSASLQSISTAAGSSPPTSPEKPSTSRRKPEEGSDKTSISKSEGDGGRKGGEAKKRKSGSSQSKGQKQTTERTPSADQLANAFFGEIAQNDLISRPVSPLSPLKTAHSSHAMPDDEAEAYFEGLKLESQKQVSQRCKREKETERRRLQKEEENRKWQEEMDQVKSQYFMDINRDGQRDREFTKAMTLAR